MSITYDDILAHPGFELDEDYFGMKIDFGGDYMVACEPEIKITDENLVYRRS